MGGKAGQGNAFLTGSRAYGTPAKDSDIDVVIPVQDEEFEKTLWSLLSEVGQPVSAKGSGPGSFQIGKLDLIFLTPEYADAWRAATVQLISEKPVTRNRAIEVIDGELAKRGLSR